jgi:hypothetical protein
MTAMVFNVHTRMPYIRLYFSSNKSVGSAAPNYFSRADFLFKVLKGFGGSLQTAQTFTPVRYQTERGQRTVVHVVQFHLAIAR